MIGNKLAVGSMRTRFGTRNFYKILTISALFCAIVAGMGKFESCHPDTKKST